jgi:hypothetical protein
VLTRSTELQQAAGKFRRVTCTYTDAVSSHLASSGRLGFGDLDGPVQHGVAIRCVAMCLVRASSDRMRARCTSRLIDPRGMRHTQLYRG